MDIGSMDESVRHQPPTFYTEIRASKDEEPLIRKRKHRSMGAPAVAKGMASARLGSRREHNVMRVGERRAGQGSTLYFPELNEHDPQRRQRWNQRCHRL